MSEEEDVQVVVSSSDEDECGDPTEAVTIPSDTLQRSPSKADSPQKSNLSNTPTTTAVPRVNVIAVRQPGPSTQYISQSNGSVALKATLASGSPATLRLVKPVNASPQTVKARPVWTSAVKNPTGNHTQRFISTNAGQHGQTTSTSGSGSPALNMLVGANKSTSYLVSPTSGVAKAVNFISYTGSDGQTKIVYQPGTSLVNQKDGRIISSSTQRPISLLSPGGGKVLTATNLGPRCVPVQAPRAAVLRGGKQVVISKAAAQTMRVQTASPRAAAPQQAGTGVQNAVVLSTSSTGANASSSSSQPTWIMSPGGSEVAGSVSAGKTVSGTVANFPAATIITSGSGANSSSVGACGANVTFTVAPNRVVTPQYSGDSAAGVQPLNSVVGSKSGIDPECIVGERTGSEVLKPQDPKPSSTSDEKKPNVDSVTVVEDPEEAEPPEKKSAKRKATILSGTKPKLKASLLNGLIEPKKPNGAQVEMTALITKSPGGVERTRKRKDNHKPTPDVEPPQKLLRTQELEGSFLKPLPGSEELRVTNVIKWDGMKCGMLPGSILRFTKNDEGMLEVLEPLLMEKLEFYEEGGAKRVKPRDPQEIYCCVNCSCYGLRSEFNTDNFCSSTCLEAFQLSVERISTKLLEEPLLPSAIIEESKKVARRKAQASAEPIDKTAVPVVKQKNSDDVSIGDTDQESAKKVKEKIPPLADDKKPMIRLKSMEFLSASQNAPGRQLRARETLPQKPLSRFLVSQDVEGVVSWDDEKIQNENTDPFPWAEYLQVTEAKPAWVKLFKNANPIGSNPFKIGFKLEAVDPERPGQICAATVADVQGHRLKIHFDGYSNKYDFWTNIDSPNIFECGFCERHNITLNPPMGMKKNVFNWAAYQAARKVRPCHLSWFRRPLCSSTNMFRPGMKLEAIDRKQTLLTCVATCTAVLEDRILVHFDSWSDVYDYWAETSSPYIHPVGWCKSRNRELTPPTFYTPSTFSWDVYLKETKSEAAPPDAFTPRSPIDWKRNTKLEVVDKRAPHLLRVATIKEVLPYQVKIAFDGFPDEFGYWVDDDCPDIHPINWGLKTGHQVTGPPEIYQIQNSPCPTPGCIGDGNWTGLHTDKHSTVEECPYSSKHLDAESPLQDRLLDRRNGPKKRAPVLGHESDIIDSDDDSDAKWKFFDSALGRYNAKGRLTSDGTFLPMPKKGGLPFVSPKHQAFKTFRPAVVKAEILPDKTSDDSGSGDKKPQVKKLERRGSDRSLDGDVSSQERKSGTKVADRKPDKTASRRSLPVKTAAAPAAPTAKGRGLDASSAAERSLTRKATRIDSAADNDVFSRIRSKVAPELSNADILTWTAEQCAQKIKDLPPKCQASFKKLELNGERFLMLTNLLQSQCFKDLTAAEVRALHNTVTSLQMEAVTGLDEWKPVRPNSKYGNSSRA